MPNWAQVLNEINQTRGQLLAASQNAANQANQAFDLVRRQYLQQLHAHTGRNIIAYYSGFLSKPGIVLLDIVDEDKNGFMMAVHQLDKTKGLDLILHTPGGRIAATQSIVDYLHKMFKGDIRAIVPQIAMSAGTMIACACHTIYLGTHSNLGPIDPQTRGLAAYGVIQEFKRAVREMKKDPSTIAAWQPILSKYHPTFLSECENAIKWSNEFVQRHLETVMFKDKANRKQIAKKIVGALTNYRQTRTHERHLHYEECEAMGLNVKKIEEDSKFQDLVLTVHHCFMHSLMNTPTFKIIENHLGVAFAKQQLFIGVPQHGGGMPVTPGIVMPQATPST